MASLTKHPKSKYWTACYTDRDGRQRKRSTKATDRNEALRIALELEAVEQKARKPGLTTSQLQKVLNEVSEKVLGESVEVPTVDDYLKDWLKSVGVRIAKPTLTRYEGTVEQFIQHLGAKARHPVSGITPKDIEAFQTARLAAKRAPKTVIVDMKTLSTAFGRAEAYGIILKNPVEPVRRPKEECSEREVFSLEEVQKLVNAAPNLEWQTLILLGYFLGARLSDCVHMKWENVHPEEGVIVYHQRKTGKKVTVPMHYHVIEHLNYRSRFGTKGQLCPTLASRVTGGRNGLSGAFRRIVEKAGLDVGIIEGKGVRKFSKRSFHSLRHSFSSVLANAGVSEELRMKLTGHSSREVHARYSHLEMEALRNAVTAIPTFKAEAKQARDKSETDYANASG